MGEPDRGQTSALTVMRSTLENAAQVGWRGCPDEYTLPQAANCSPWWTENRGLLQAAWLWRRAEGAALSMPSALFNPTSQITPSSEKSKQGVERGQEIASQVARGERVVTSRISVQRLGGVD